MKQRDIFIESMQKEEGEERRAFLDAACGDDVELRNSVEELLAEHRKDDSFFLDAPPPGMGATADMPAITEKPGTQIGPYKLLQQIGEGGMGVVYMAEQTDPVQRRVALKIIKPGMDTQQVIARFEAERQALAMMDHPNIAKVLDAGTTESGRPYFVMELVKGVPITEYCDEQQLTPRERLELFLPICQAVQHAHLKGVIHRDLKPSNILVARYDDKPVPKVIDFGLAKAVSHRLTEKTMFTQHGQILGTFEYMSPEQAQFNQLDVDTRSDVYSLGVLLYELLTGNTPFDKRRLRSAAYDELVRIIREEEPPRPSVRLSTCETLPSIAAHRHVEPHKLSSLIRGELDWIVMKALEKDRTRRYETASSFAADVQHYLKGEAVAACPPSAAYRFRKFARRNKAAIGTTAIVAASLVIGIIGTGWQAVRATRERDRAITAEGLAEDEARRAQNAEQQAIAEAKRADAEATRSQQVALFLTDMLAAAGPHVAQGRDATLLMEVLAQASERIETDLQGQPEVQGDLLSTLGITYQDIGDHELAIAMFKRAAEALRIEPGEPNAKLALVLARQGFSHSFTRDMPTGTRVADFGLEMAREVDDDEALAQCLYYRARASNEFGMGSGEAQPYTREALELYRKIGGHPVEEAKCLRSLATHGDDIEERESLARQSLQIIRDHLGPDDPETMSTVWTLAQNLLQQGKVVEAEQLLRETLVMWEKFYSEDHPLYYVVRIHFARSLALQDKWEEAYQVMDDTPSASRPKEKNFIDFLSGTCELQARMGRFDDAKLVIEKVKQKLADVQSEYGPNHELTQLYQNRLTEMREMLTLAKWTSD